MIHIIWSGGFGYTYLLYIRGVDEQLTSFKQKEKIIRIKEMKI